jgi:NitT/TauT family transport system permease protein
MKMPEFTRSRVHQRTWPIILDAAVFGAMMAIIWAMVAIGRYWFSAAVPAAEISRSPRALPLYAFYSLVRMAAAYLLSLVFAVGYGYAASYSKRWRSVLLAILDILQSIPVLSFLPGVMLAMVALFPTRQMGVEFGSIILIFTGQVWNMAFSFYASLQAIPRELREASRVYRFSRLQRFVQLELPYGAIGLVWNSMVSVAGGWFFLMACEMFVLGSRDFRLPGLGSFLQSASSAGDTGAILWGLGAMIFVIVMIDQLIWRPAIAWCDKFKFEQVEANAAPSSAFLNLLRRSPLLGRIRQSLFVPLSERAYSHPSRQPAPLSDETSSRTNTAVGTVIAIVLLLVTIYGVAQAIFTLRTLTLTDLRLTVEGAVATFLRVAASLILSSAWAIPAGVAIGFHPRMARIAQPLAQVAASVPATALFPVILLGLISLGGGLGVGSILLMLLGTQWYILFNVIAGAIAIPSDLKEVADLFRFSTVQRWRTVILPGIYPYLITGLVTASGGAWNASIVAEYFHLKGQVLFTFGLGAQISSATDKGNFALLLLSTMVMATIVVTVNRLLWRPLYRLGETRYRLES